MIVEKVVLKNSDIDIAQILVYFSLFISVFYSF